MHVIITDAGSECLEHPEYLGRRHRELLRVVGEDHLWIGFAHHLDKNEVKELVDYLLRWIETGSLLGERAKNERKD